MGNFVLQLQPGERIVNFGAIKVPPGYSVVWSESLRRYYGVAPSGETSPTHWRRQSALWWCKKHAGGAS